MYILMPVVFMLGIFAIALEDKININKSAIALLMSFLLWLMLMLGAHDILVVKQNVGFANYLQQSTTESLSINEQLINYIVDKSFIRHLGDVSQTLLFVMCSLLIINIVDKYGGFVAISKKLRTNNKRKLLWYIGFSSFFFSALFDNLAAAIVLIAVLRKLVPHRTDRLKYACMVIIAANAGGSWSPIGDVTTLLLWTGGNISALNQISTLFLPALANMLVPMIVAHFWLFKKGVELRQRSDISEDDLYIEQIPNRSRITIFWIGLLSIAMVPVFQTMTKLPAFMCVMIGLSALWIYTDLTYGRISEIKDSDKLKVQMLTRSIDMPTIFFFLGILMSVAALTVGGQLGDFSNLLTKHLKEPYAISVVIGAFSSLIDNVALVAASMGMYPLVDASMATTPYLNYFVADGGFWLLLAYSAVTGGSIFIIGSATGVAVMGLEKISFGYFFRRFTPLALLGYVSGIAVFLLMSIL